MDRNYRQTTVRSQSANSNAVFNIGTKPTYHGGFIRPADRYYSKR